MTTTSADATSRRAVTATLRSAGFLAAGAEARALLAASAGDPGTLEALLGRRLTGEPLAWITGTASLCGVALRIRPGVYVPRPHTAMIVRRAAARLPPRGTAVDLCTGSGAIAAVLHDRRPDARIIAVDIDPTAVACARDNSVDARLGDGYAPLPRTLRGAVDVIVTVPPYVPTGELPLLQRDTFTFETPLAYDGGGDGLRLLRRIVRGAKAWLRCGGVLLAEIGGRQDALVVPMLTAAGFDRIRVIRDSDGDVRGVEARLATPSPREDVRSSRRTRSRAPSRGGGGMRIP